MNYECKVVIAGAGVAGLAMASLLARLPQRAALQITLLDVKEPAPFAADADVGLRVSAIAAGSMKLLQDLGIRGALEGRACPYRDMRVWDERGDAFGSDALHFAAAEVALPELGFIVEDALLRDALYRDLRDYEVDFRFGSGIAAVEHDPEACIVTLEDGKTFRADLLIGADGAQSAVRAFSGIDADGWDYAQAAVVSHARPAHSHRNTAWQRFLPDGPIALLPLADGRVSIVWSTSTDMARELLAADDAKFSAALTEASGAVLGDLTAAAKKASFPLRAQHAQHYVRKAVALIGDAAHTVHPLAGQGANLGLADAAALAEIIDGAIAAGEFPGDLPVLRRYERQRRGANSAMLQFIDALNRLFAGGEGLGELRQAGMGMFNRSGTLKRQAMQVAIGL